MLAMGYGSTFQDTAQHLGGSGDGGLDGVINEDRLGLDSIYLQAKRWQNNVGRPELQAFVGALVCKGARKGVFITTSKFTKEARDYAEALKDQRVVLVDGERLATLMIEHNVGVSTREVITVKRLDQDYFEEYD